MIDGSKFKAASSRDRNVTRGKMKRRLKEAEKSVGRYPQQLDSADRQEPPVARTAGLVLGPAAGRTRGTARLTDKIAMLKEETKRLRALEAEMPATPDQQISSTDLDARSMAMNARGSGVVGHNVQAAIDTTPHLIAAMLAA